MDDAIKLARLAEQNAEIARQEAEIERLRGEIRLEGFLNSHRLAAQEYERYMQPLDEMPTGKTAAVLIPWAAKKFPELAYRWLKLHDDMPPTVDELVDLFSEEVRYSEDASRRLLGIALDDPGVPIYLEDWAEDFYVEVEDAAVPMMYDLFDMYEHRDTALHDAYIGMAAGDPDPFGLIAEAEAQ